MRNRLRPTVQSGRDFGDTAASGCKDRDVFQFQTVSFSTNEKSTKRHTHPLDRLLSGVIQNATNSGIWVLPLTEN